jgi:hypothetical protein
MLTSRGTCAALLGLMLAAPGAAQQSTIQLRTSGFFQTQFTTTTVNEQDVAPAFGEVPLSTFEVRRARIILDATLGDWISGRMQPDFGQGRVRLADAWINFAFARQVELRVGQFKKPFSRIELTSIAALPMIERGLRIRHIDAALLESAARGDMPVPGLMRDVPVLGEHYQMLEALLYSGRDLGMALHGRLGPLAYTAGVFNGEGAERRDVTDRKSGAARVWLPASGGRPLSFGAAASYRETAAGVDGFAYQLDAEWGRADAAGLRLLAEAATGENLALPGERFTGAQAVLSYRSPRRGARLAGVEPLLRVSYGDPSHTRARDEGWLLTPGLNLVLVPRARFSLNWELYLPAAAAVQPASGLRAQAQVAF